ncbi:hypothetical protein D3C71_1038740 [compost metagenome]
MLVERVALHHRVEGPQDLAAFRLERLDDIMRRAEIERAIHFDRRRFERVFLGILIFLAQVAGMVFPGDLQAFDVFDVDVLQRRITLAEIGAAIGSPVVGGIGNTARIGCRICGSRLFKLPGDRQRIVEPCDEAENGNHCNNGAQGKHAILEAWHPRLLRAVAQAVCDEGEAEQQT